MKAWAIYEKTGRCESSRRLIKFFPYDQIQSKDEYMKKNNYWIEWSPMFGDQYRLVCEEIEF